MAVVRLGNSSLEATKTADGDLYLHALILVDGDTHHFQRDAKLVWHDLGVVQRNCTAPASIISKYYTEPVVDDPGSDSGSDAVPEYLGSAATIVQSGHANLYYRDGYTIPFGFNSGPISTNASQVTAITSGNPSLGASFAYDSDLRHVYDCLVLEGSNLVYYYTDNIEPPTATWERGAVVSTQATGAACCTKSPYRANKQVPHNREALVPEGNNMVHYWMDGATQVWQRTVVVSTFATAPAAILVSADRANVNDPGNLEVLIPEGNQLVHYWRNDSAAGAPWSRGPVVSTNCSGPASFVMGFYGDPKNPNFEALVQEGNTVFHYWRDNSQASMPWNRDVAVVSG